MHKAILEQSIEQVRQRASEGDNPVTPSFSVEWLEEMVLALSSPGKQEPIGYIGQSSADMLRSGETSGAALSREPTKSSTVPVFTLPGFVPSSPGKDGGQEVEAATVLGYVREAGLRSLAERNHTSVYPSPDEERGYTIPVYAQPASTALVERLGLAWAAVGHHEGIEISVHADAADTWNALCAILDPLARSALSASQSTSREGESRG